MGMIYLVRKKLFRSKEGMKQLYYAVQRTLQPRGGVTTEKLAQRMARRKGMGEGDVQSVLVDLPKYIEEALSEGESVTIRGLGSFNLAITSEGFEHPDDVMPGKVRVSRMDFFRYPLSKYFPHEMLRPETLERERVQTPNKPEDETKDIDTVTG